MSNIPSIPQQVIAIHPQPPGQHALELERTRNRRLQAIVTELLERNAGLNARIRELEEASR